eukprot:CAMPEP_0182593382 /NCGR_PEP_ID=MMETSP1324-20130603/77922_1 /TAXON_ID=236786 /ORGANISM="Florenciella sp., Strain RCC1587" /LENGTH=54 /DNA_ID=CAMNT_0024810843 /DNA_START=33 /DNA_END=197 /DNA_ORIENTATION=+
MSDVSAWGLSPSNILIRSASPSPMPLHHPFWHEQSHVKQQRHAGMAITRGCEQK